jgi:hypothetical protein
MVEPMPMGPSPEESDPAPDHGPASADQAPIDEETAEDRKRVVVIALFVIGSIAVAVVLAIFYGMPSAD